MPMAPGGGGGSTPAHHLSWPAITFSFERNFKPFTFTVQDGEFEVEVKLTGEITMWKKGSVGNFEIDGANGKVSAGLVKEYKTQFAQFVGETKFFYDAKSKKAGLEGGLAVTSGDATPNWAPQVQSNGPTIDFIQNPPIPVQFTAGPQWKFKGDLGYDIGITVKPSGDNRFGPNPAYVLETVKSASLVQSGGSNILSGLLHIFEDVLGGIIAAGGIIVTIGKAVTSEPLPVPAVVRQVSFAEAARLYNWSPQIL